jgi:hypothetical protein
MIFFKANQFHKLQSIMEKVKDSKSFVLSVEA